MAFSRKRESIRAVTFLNPRIRGGDKKGSFGGRFVRDSVKKGYAGGSTPIEAT
jgi:hypothetical protein